MTGTTTAAAAPATAARTRVLAVVAPGPATLAAALRRLGAHEAATLAPAALASALDAEHARALLPTLDPTDPWAPVVAALCDDPDTLAALAQRQLDAYDPTIGWLPATLAGALAGNPATPEPYALRLAVQALWEQLGPAARARVENVSPTAENLQALIASVRALRGRSSLLDRVRDHPDLAAGNALRLLAFAGEACEDAGSQVLVDALLRREDLLEVLQRGPDGSDPDVLAASLAALRQIAQDHHGHPCMAPGRIAVVLRWLAADDALPVTDAVLAQLRADPHGRLGLARRTDLSGPTLAALLPASDDPTYLTVAGTLAANPSCPDELLAALPADVAGDHLVLRLAAGRFGDSPTQLTEVLSLLERPEVSRLRIDAVLALAEHR